MEKNELNLSNKIYSNNINNILLSIIHNLELTIKDIKDNITIKRLNDIITKINVIIIEHEKNVEINKQMNKEFNDIRNNTNNNQEIKYNSDLKNDANKRFKYIGQILNGVPEGKGIMYWENGVIMMVNGKMIKWKEKEFIILMMEIYIRAILKMDYQKVMEYFIILMVSDMKVILRMI